MPIVGHGTWLPTIDEYGSHWDAANVELGATPATDVKLKGNYTRANFASDRNALEVQIIAISGLENNRQILADQRDIQKAALKKRLSQFRAGVACYLDETPYVGALPLLPNFGSAESIFLEPFDDMANLWDKINDDVTTPGWTGPLTLAGGYALAQFVVDLAALRATYVGLTDAEKDLQLGRGKRDGLFKPIYKRLKQYAGAVGNKFDEESSIFTSVPALTPPAGSTPEPVALSAAWNSTTNLADLVWTPSSNPDLKHYVVYTHPVPKWKNAERVQVAIVPAGTTTHATAFALAAPGSETLLGLAVVLNTENEKLSNVVKVTRPET